MNILDPEFQGPFNSEEELEAAMDALVITSHGPPGNEAVASVVDENRFSQVEFVVRTLGFLSRESGAEIIYEAHNPTYDACTVKIETSDLLFRSSWISRCVSLADLITIQPTLNNTIVASMVFYGLVRRTSV